MTASKALAGQVGGNHYKKGIQPFALSIANGHDGCIHAIQKYLTRFARQDPAKGYEALKKAHHICDLRVDLLHIYGVTDPGKPFIAIRDYIRSNELDMATAAAIIAVEEWSQNTQGDQKRQSEVCRSLIRDVAREHFPDTFKREDFEL